MGASQNQNGLQAYYTGSPVMPEIPDFEDLEKDIHYTMMVKDNVNVGTATITLQGIGVCTGTYIMEFEVVPYVLSVNSIEVEYRNTTYNGKVQKPSVTIKANLVEGRDYFISYVKKVDGEYQETEPKEVGKYWIAVHVTDNVLIRQAGVSDTDAPDCYYIDYSIDGNCPGSSDTGSGTGDSGSGTGNSGTGSETGSSGSGTVSSGTGSETEDSQSAIGNSGTENGSENNDSATVSKTVTNNQSSNKTKVTITYNAAYKIKKLKLVSKKKAIKLSWTKVKKAEGYQIQISLNKKYKKAKTIYVKKSKKSYTLKKLKKKKKYYIRIRAYSGKGKKKVYGKWRASSKKTK